MDLTMQIDRQREQLAELERRAREEAAVDAIRREEADARRAAAIAEHELAEREHAAELAALAKTLTDTRKDLAATVDTAVKALTALWDLAVSYGNQLDQAAGELIDAGLPARWEEGDLAVRFDIGGHKPSGFGGPRLLLAGQEWTPIHPRQAVAYALELAAAARVPGAQVPDLQPVSDVLGDLVKTPKTIPAPPQPRPQLADIRDVYGPEL